MYSPCKMDWGNGGTEVVSVANPWLVQLQTYAMRGSPCPTLPGWPGTRSKTVQRHRIELDMSSKEKKINAMIPNNILLLNQCLAICHQRSIIQQPMGADIGTHCQTLRGARGTPPHPFPLPHHKKREKKQAPKRMRDTMRIWPTASTKQGS